jgi:hypothetical protein
MGIAVEAPPHPTTNNIINITPIICCSKL